MLGYQYVGGTLYLLTYVDLGWVGPSAAAFIPLVGGAGQTDHGDAFQIHLIPLGHFDEPSFLTASGDHAQPHLGIGCQQQVHCLWGGVLGPEHEVAKIVAGKEQMGRRCRPLGTQGQDTIHLAAAQEVTDGLPQ
jgi:hypothetical protein